MKSVVYTQRVEIIESYQERRDCADQRIADFILKCGYLPVPMPNREELVEDFVHMAKPAGIVLTGGNSLLEYGGNAPERDAVDEALIHMAVNEKIPLYGFCRGMQSILVHFGNKLEKVSGHVAVRHVIRSQEGQAEVNSYHNQACLYLEKGCGLNIVAKTEDGVIEQIRHSAYPILGTMWHPEREESFSEYDISRVRKLFG